MPPQTFGPEPPGLWSRVARPAPPDDSVASVRGALAVLQPQRRRRRRRRQAVHTTVVESRWVGRIVERNLDALIDGSSRASSVAELLGEEEEDPPRDRSSRWQDVVCAIGEAEEPGGSGACSLHYSKIGD